jgi:hypothetical protein
MPPRLGLYSLANTPEELLSQGYGMVNTEFAEDPAFGNLTYNTAYNPAPYTGAMPFQNVFRISEGVSNNFDNPSYGGSGNSRFNQFEPEGILSQVDSRFPLYDDFTVAEEGDDLEDNAVTVDELGNLKQPSGFKDFLKTILGFAIPGAGLFTGDRSALEGIKSLNQRLRNTDFGRSKTLADYFDARRYGGRDARDAAAARTMAQARGLTKSLASRPSSTSGGYQQGPGGSGAQSTGASNKGSSGADYSSAGTTGAKAGFGYGL